MKKLTVFTMFFIASFAIGATPILIGIALVYAVAWFLSQGTAKTAETPPAPTPATPPPYGGTHRKIQP
jgi:ABC-type antimicrobial peptide transport system permease subunit